jgi:hypothetical protein
MNYLKAGKMACLKSMAYKSASIYESPPTLMIDDKSHQSIKLGHTTA